VTTKRLNEPLLSWWRQLNSLWRHLILSVDDTLTRYSGCASWQACPIQVPFVYDFGNLDVWSWKCQHIVKIIQFIVKIAKLLYCCIVSAGEWAAEWALKQDRAESTPARHHETSTPQHPETPISVTSSHFRHRLNPMPINAFNVLGDDVTIIHTYHSYFTQIWCYLSTRWKLNRSLR